MKEIILSTVGNIYSGELKKIFNNNDFAIAEYKNKTTDYQELFFYCSPEAFLAIHLSTESKLSMKVILKQWCDQISKTLDYVITKPKACLLIDLEYMLKSPNDFNVFFKKKFEIDFNYPPSLFIDEALLATACSYLIDNEQVQEVYEDFAAAADYLLADCFTAIERLHSYVNKMQEDFEFSRKNNLKLINENDNLNLLKVTNLQEELEQSIVNNAQFKKDNDNLIVENNQIKEEFKSLNDINEKQKSNLDINKTENDLALLKMISLQEELEESAVINAQFKKDNDNLIVEINQIKEEFKSLNDINEKQKSNLGINKTENDLALLKMISLQEELEESAVINAKFKKDNDNLIVKTNKIKDELKLLNEINEKLTSNLELNKTESDLVLLKMASLQEELETTTNDNIQLTNVNISSAAKLIESENEQKILNESNNNLHRLLDKSKLEYDFLFLQVTNLQEELEVNMIPSSQINNSTSLCQEDKDLNNENAVNGSVVDPINGNLQAELNDTKIENELAISQIVQLQEELESLFIKSQNINNLIFKKAKKDINILNISTSIKLANLLNINTAS